MAENEAAACPGVSAVNANTTHLCDKHPAAKNFEGFSGGRLWRAWVSSVERNSGGKSHTPYNWSFHLRDAPPGVELLL